MHQIYIWSKNILKNRKLILDLSANDFKMRFSGAVLGTVWAFVHPLVTILVYWFVFQIGFRTGNSNGTDVPYALWLSTGLIPWFFFSEAWNTATNSLMDYSYLVKKVVFDVSIIPIVKILSALFVHIFFVALLLLMFLVNNISPCWHWLQIIYYSFAMLLFVIGVSYATSALTLFFRDLSQLISVILQIGVWMTPIMWDITVAGIPSSLSWLFVINPMFYIIQGYRQSLIYHTWLWENMKQGIYFWIVTLFLLVFGQRIFMKLKPHFADVI